jgi:type I restriction enzyme S subunit
MRTVSELQDEGILLVEDGNHGEYRPRSEEFGEGEYSFIRAADLDSGRVLFESAERINDKAMDRIRKGVGQGGDILFSHKGTVGKLALSPLDSPPFVCSPQTTLWRSLDQDRLDRRYLYCFMRSRAFTEQWMARSNETDMAAYVSLTAQRQLKVAVPTIEEQRAIARILGALDEKIEQNRKTAQLLERLARATFRAWFVDFEPVKAKAAGATDFPSMPQSVFDALPTRFVDSDIGPVPEGWEVLRLDEIILLQRGFDLPKQSRTDGAHPVFAASGLNGWHSEWKVRGPGVTTGRSGVLGQVHFVDRDFWPLNTSLWVKEYKRSNPWHAYFLLETLDLAQFNAGSAVPTLNRNHVHSLPIVAPPDKLLEAFGQTCTSTFSLDRQLRTEVDTLAAMRDYLLPKLLGGDVRVEAVHG